MVKHPIWGNRKLVLDDEEYKRIEKVVLEEYPNICEEDLKKYVKHIFKNNVRQYKLLEQNPHRSVDGYDYVPKYLLGTKIGRENYKNYQYKVYCELEGSYLSKEELFDVWEGRSDKGMFDFGTGEIIPSRGPRFEEALRLAKRGVRRTVPCVTLQKTWQECFKKRMKEAGSEFLALLELIGLLLIIFVFLLLILKALPYIGRFLLYIIPILLKPIEWLFAFLFWLAALIL